MKKNIYVLFICLLSKNSIYTNDYWDYPENPNNIRNPYQMEYSKEELAEIKEENIQNMLKEELHKIRDQKAAQFFQKFFDKPLSIKNLSFFIMTSISETTSSKNLTDEQLAKILSYGESLKSSINSDSRYSKISEKINSVFLPILSQKIPGNIQKKIKNSNNPVMYARNNFLKNPVDQFDIYNLHILLFSILTKATNQ